jgi:hypothetical protein
MRRPRTDPSSERNEKKADLVVVVVTLCLLLGVPASGGQ